jgi:hypothetical protein
MSSGRSSGVVVTDPIIPHRRGPKRYTTRS